MRYLITGANGQLANEFQRKLSELNVTYFAFSKEELDISNLQVVLRVFEEVNPSVVINCAAYNLVDKAESGPEDAVRVNSFGVANLVFASKKRGSFLVHYSSDYVFDGTKKGLYTEEDKTNPINEYGKSKLFGEFFIREQMDNYLIFRTSWVYGRGKQNFLYKLNTWCQNQEYLRITCDEYSVPTSTRTIVELTLLALKKGLSGLYHLVNNDYASRYEWAKEYLRLKGIKKLIYPAYQQEFSLPAKRPFWSAMSPEKISKELNIEIKPWQIDIKELIDMGML